MRYKLRLCWGRSQRSFLQLPNSHDSELRNLRTAESFGSTSNSHWQRFLKQFKKQGQTAIWRGPIQGEAPWRACTAPSSAPRAGSTPRTRAVGAGAAQRGPELSAGHRTAPYAQAKPSARNGNQKPVSPPVGRAAPGWPPGAGDTGAHCRRPLGSQRPQGLCAASPNRQPPLGHRGPVPRRNPRPGAARAPAPPASVV